VLRRLGIGLGILVCATAIVSVAAARQADTADMSINISSVPGTPAKVEGIPFSVGVGVGNAGPGASHFQIRVELPDGVRLVRGGDLECAGTSELVCFSDDAPAGYDADGSTSVVASAPGTYRFVARLTELSANDPNLQNNEAALTVSVGKRAQALVTRGLAVRPAKPVAGSRFTVSFSVFDQTAGKRVVPAAARCTASPGRARARVLSGRATCTVTTASTAKGKTVRGVITAIVGARALPKRFSVVLR
jgi:hypothetical protein